MHHQSLQNIKTLNAYILLLCDCLLRGRGFRGKDIYKHMMTAVEVRNLYRLKDESRLFDLQQHYALLPWFVKFMKVSK